MALSLVVVSLSHSAESLALNASINVYIGMRRLTNCLISESWKSTKIELISIIVKCSWSARVCFFSLTGWCRQQKVLYVSLDSISEHLLSNHWRCICWCIKCWEFKMNFRRNVDSFGVSRSMHFAFRNFAFDLKNLILFIEFLNLNYNDNNSWKKSLVMGFMNVFFFRCPSISLVGSAVRNCVCVCVSMCSMLKAHPFFDGIWNVLHFQQNGKVFGVSENQTVHW